MIKMALQETNRWGKTPVTIYGEGFQSELDMLSFDMGAGVGRTYRYYREPLFAFGTGLSLVCSHNDPLRKPA